MTWACHLALGSIGHISNAKLIKLSQNLKLFCRFRCVIHHNIVSLIREKTIGERTDLNPCAPCGIYGGYFFAKRNERNIKTTKIAGPITSIITHINNITPANAPIQRNTTSHVCKSFFDCDFVYDAVFCAVGVSVIALRPLGLSVRISTGLAVVILYTRLYAAFFGLDQPIPRLP